jgi:hypothetical protein
LKNLTLPENVIPDSFLSRVERQYSLYVNHIVIQMVENAADRTISSKNSVAKRINKRIESKRTDANDHTSEIIFDLTNSKLE